MGCGEFLVKYKILLFANICVALTGLALIGISIAIQVNFATVISIIDIGGWYDVPIASMVVGFVMFLVAILGSCGAIRENNRMLITYSLLMVVLLVLKLALAGIVFTNADELAMSVESEFKYIFVVNLEKFHKIETSLSCCGPDGPASYGYITSLPPSCCDKNTEVCSVLNANYGCHYRARDLIKPSRDAIGEVFTIVAALEFVAAICGLSLASHLRNRDRRTKGPISGTS